MKNFKIILGALLALLILTEGFGQAENEMVKKKMMALEMMVGEWQGEGWMMSPSREKVDFTQKESIRYGLNGSILMINGQGWDKEDKMIHNAFANIYYDLEKGAYGVHSFLEDGKQTLADLSILEDGSVQWSFSPGGAAIIKYTMSFTDETWNEKGEYSPNGEMWFPFIEFTLKKKS